MASSLVQWRAPSSQQHGWGDGRGGQFNLSSVGGIGERMGYSPSWKRSRSRPLVSTHSQSQPAPAPAPAPRIGVKFQAVAETLQLAQTALEGPPAGKLNVVLEAARTEEKLRAAAALRARSFYSYPEGRSRDALVVHCSLSRSLSLSLCVWPSKP